MGKNKPSILIVEDDLVLSMVVSRMVEKLGYVVSGRANSGEEAISEVQKNPPDAILMDIKLQGSMNGFDAMKRIRKFNHTPVIYVSGHSTEDSHRTAEKLGCSGYLVKPIRSDDLKGALGRLFNPSVTCPQPSKNGQVI